MPSTSSMTPWGKQGEEATTSTVLRVSARATAAAVTLMSLPTGTCNTAADLWKGMESSLKGLRPIHDCCASSHFRPVIVNMLIAPAYVVSVLSWSKVSCAFAQWRRAIEAFHFANHSLRTVVALQADWAQDNAAKPSPLEHESAAHHHQLDLEVLRRLEEGGMR